MSATFHCLKTNYGRDYCYDIGLGQCEICKADAARQEATEQRDREQRYFWDREPGQ